MNSSVLFCSFLLASTTVHAAGKLQFNRDIRPILSDKCFFCHGTDANHRKGDLRLDQKESAFKPAKSGETAIVPGHPEKSALVTRVHLPTTDDDLMPPLKSEKTLSGPEKALLEQWIREGAEYQGHWAFIPPVRPPVPKTSPQPIDAFVLDRLQKEGLKPSPEADRATLIRRVTLDLTGLPPTPEEVAAFEKDPSPNAYEHVVDRLLQSPHYGERMAMPWLDSARYADSHGFQTDSSRSQWPWRDWVIKAFNTNMPFDEFTIEQIAGDLLPNATRDQVVATGFNRNHRLNGEGGIIAEEWRIENVIDRAETTGMTWLALTFNCCRCHDHKFDPITQKDFYSFFAFFNNLPESGTIQGASNRSGGNSQPTVEVPTKAQEEQLAKLDAAVKQAQAKVKEAEKQLPQLLAAWEPRAQETVKKMASAWSVLTPTKVESKGGATLTKQGDGSYLAEGKNPPKDIYVFDAPIPSGGASAFLLECLTDPSLPGGGAGRNTNSNFALSQFDVYVQKPGGKPELVTLARAEADYSQKGYEIENVIQAKKSGRSSWAVDGPTKKEPRRAMFVLDAPVPGDKGTMLMLRLRHEAINNHNIGRFRLSSTSLPGKLVKLSGDAFSPVVKAALEVAADKRTVPQNKELAQFFRTAVDSPVKQADDALASAKKAYESFDNTLPTVMVMKEMEQPRDAFVLFRGEYDKPKDKVTAALPASLPPMPKGEPMNRLGLAKWMVNGQHPLTARVWVNRQWEKFFGTGLVKTVENFGMQAEYPSHPELLDWMATEFVRLKWDMKAIQKLMVMSATYRQQSKITPELLAKDSDNRLLARGPRFRLGAEMVRDQVLAASGLLVDKVGGPSVRPYMPEGVWDETSKYGDLRGYKNDSGDALYRRTMYTIWKRTAAPPTMLIFDSPTREICTVKRSRTNTPLQALAMLNEVTFVEAARSLAERMILQGGKTPEQRIRWAFKKVTSRDPSPQEMQVVTGGLVKRLSDFKADPEGAKQLIAFGEKKADAHVNVSELAAYVMTANVLLNLDEVVTRQ